MLERKSKWLGLLFIFMPFLLIDVVQFLGSTYYSQSFGSFACTVFLYLQIPALLIPHPLIVFAHNQCAEQPQEPAISIIFFVLKIVIAAAIGTVLAFRSIYLPKKGIEQYGKQLPYVEGSMSEIKYNLLVILGCILLGYLLFHNLYEITNNAVFIVIRKSKENLSCLVVIVIAALITRDFLIIIRNTLKWSKIRRGAL